VKPKAPVTEAAITLKNISVLYTSPTHANMSIKETAIRLLKGQYDGPRYFNALDQVSVTVAKGEAVAFIGPNGCGKSTLLKVVAGVIAPQNGEVITDGIIAPLIELGAGFDQELNGIDNIWMACRLIGASNELIRAKMDEIIDFAELGDFMYAPVKTYSSGMYMRLGFACSTIINPEILLIDEILAVGDARFQKKCLDRIHQIRGDGKTVVIVSHDRGIIESICSRAVFLWKGQLIYQGVPRLAFQIYEALAASPHLHDKPREVAEEVLRLDQLRREVPKAADCNTASFITYSGDVRQLDGTRVIDIACRVRLRKQLAQPMVVGFQVLRLDGGRVFGTNTKYQGILLEDQVERLRAPGEFSVRWQLDAQLLASGSYMIEFCVSNFEITEVFEYLSGACALQVINPTDRLNHDGNTVELTTQEFIFSSV